MEKTLEELTFAYERLQAAQDCRNLMGKYSYYHSAMRNQEYIELWAKRDDCVLEMPWGIYEGWEGVKACYLDDHGDRSDPAVLEQFRGTLGIHLMDTEVIEVAADGKTARGCWFSPGLETMIDHENDKAIAEWAWSKYAVDFIKDENGVWKFWRMRLYPFIKAEYNTPWTEYPQPNPEDFPFTNAKPRSSEPYVWGKDKSYPANQPEPPLPYNTYSDIGYCL